MAAEVGARRDGRAERVPSGSSGATRPADPPRRRRCATSPGGSGCAATPAGDPVVTGISLSSQRVLPGDLYAALPGRPRARASFAAEAVAARRRRRAHRRRRAALLRRRRRRPGAGRRAAPRGCSAASPRGSTATRPTGAADDRRDRHPGQDHHHPARRGRPSRRPASAPAVIGTVGTRVAGEDVKTVADHPGGARPARPVRDDARARRRRLRDGGLQPRAGDGPRRRRRLRRRGASPTSGRDHLDFHADVEDYFARQGRRCSPPSAPGSAWSTSTTSTAAGWPRRRRSRSGRSRATGARGGLAAVDVAPGADRLDVHRASARTASASTAGVPLPGDFNVANALAAIAALRRGRLRRRRAVAAAIGRRRAACPGRLEQVDAGQDFLGRRRLRPQARRRRGRAARRCGRSPTAG